jgi:hypothetical protein
VATVHGLAKMRLSAIPATPGLLPAPRLTQVAQRSGSGRRDCIHRPSKQWRGLHQSAGECKWSRWSEAVSRAHFMGADDRRILGGSRSPGSAQKSSKRRSALAGPRVWPDAPYSLPQPVRRFSDEMGQAPGRLRIGVYRVNKLGD